MARAKLYHGDQIKGVYHQSSNVLKVRVAAAIGKHKIVALSGDDNNYLKVAAADKDTAAHAYYPLFLTTRQALATSPEESWLDVTPLGLASGLDTSASAVGAIVYLGDSGAPSLTSAGVKRAIGFVHDVSSDTTINTWVFAPEQAAAYLTGPGSRFVSAEQTATGSAQNVAHGLGVVPSQVVIAPTGGDDGAGSAGTQFPTIAEGTHTSTNVVVTVDAAATFKVIAWR